MASQKNRSRLNLWLSVAGLILLLGGSAYVAARVSSFRLGLDLQGGSHLVYEADMSNIADGERGNALEGVRDVIERRVNAFGVSEPVVLTNVSGSHYQVIVELAGLQDVTAATKEIGETPILEFKVPVKEVNVQVTPEDEAKAKEAQVGEREAALAVLDKALAGEDFSTLGESEELTITSETPVFGELADQIRSKRYKPGVIDGLYESGSTMHVVNYLERADETQLLLSHLIICHSESEGCKNDRTKVEAKLLIDDLAKQITTKNFAELATANSEDGSAAKGGDLGWTKPGQMVKSFEEPAYALKDGQISGVVETEFGYHLIYRRDSKSIAGYKIAHIEMPWTTAGDLVVVDPWENTDLSGKQLKSASVAFDPNTNVPLVILSFNSEGAELFGKLTEDHVGEVIGIFLDGTPISTPTVQTAIYGGEATITGQFTIAEAKLLAQRLTAGALPVPVELVNQQTIGPTLGQASLDASIKAVIIGFILVAIFMIVWYRLPGVLAVISLLLYVAINLALYKAFGVTITISGLAGFVLSMGIAMDANVLIFERLQEELRSGRDLPTAVDEGFRRAWTSIRDGNATTLIASGVLFLTSTGFVKGFALVLSMGVLVSLFTAIFATRILMQWVVGFKFLHSPWLFKGLKRS